MAYIGKTPASAALTSSDISDGIITTTKIADDAATADKIANAVNSAITANTSKTTNATHSGEVTGSGALTIADNVVDEANLKVSNSPVNGYNLVARSGNTGGMTWEAAAGGTNTPAFAVKLSGNQSIANETTTKITFDSEIYDTDNAFASNKFTVPSGKGGKYMLFANAYVGTGGQGSYLRLSMYKNGSVAHESIFTDSQNIPHSSIVSMAMDLSASDYIELYAWQNSGQGDTLQSPNTIFYGYKLIE